MSETHEFITSLCCMKREHYSKRMLRKQDCIKFLWAYCMTEFFWKQLCWFPRCSAGKKNQVFVQPLVAFPISNISYSCAVLSKTNINRTLNIHLTLFIHQLLRQLWKLGVFSLNLKLVDIFENGDHTASINLWFSVKADYVSHCCQGQKARMYTKCPDYRIGVYLLVTK